MNTYTVTWTIELDAESAHAASVEALKVQRDPDSMATVFEVTDKNGEVETIDLIDEANPLPED